MKINIYLLCCCNYRSFGILSLDSKRLLDLLHHGFCGLGTKFDCQALFMEYSTRQINFFSYINSKLFLCRYSSFLVFYPTGISSEVGLIYIALPFIKVNIWIPNVYHRIIRSKAPGCVLSLLVINITYVMI